MLPLWHQYKFKVIISTSNMQLLWLWLTSPHHNTFALQCFKAVCVSPSLSVSVLFPCRGQKPIMANNSLYSKHLSCKQLQLNLTGQHFKTTGHEKKWKRQSQGLALLTRLLWIHLYSSISLDALQSGEKVQSNTSHFKHLQMDGLHSDSANAGGFKPCWLKWEFWWWLEPVRYLK